MTKQKGKGNKKTVSENEYCFEDEAKQNQNFPTTHKTEIILGNAKGLNLDRYDEEERSSSKEKNSKKTKTVKILYEIREILNERWRDGKKQLLVCWKNQNKSENIWIDADEIMEVEQNKLKSMNKNKSAYLVNTQENVVLVKKGIKNKIKKQNFIRRHANHLKIEPPDMLSINRETVAKKQSLERSERKNKREVVIKAGFEEKNKQSEIQFNPELLQEKESLEIGENFASEENESQTVELSKGKKEMVRPMDSFKNKTDFPNFHNVIATTIRVEDVPEEKHLQQMKLFSINNEIVNPKQFKWNKSELKLLNEFYKKKIPSNIEIKEDPSPRNIFNRLDHCLESDDD